ncbi:hypothetical protein [Sphingomonas faeni]|uniref:hypothetical protein n=1 Tax=Sphingomonas faeni TaxID=185950 RepID=UPI0020C7EF4E|nr:hypothetical protein [Sphingomonas faeni]MCP8892665.1 hypothetical protein [Sphingomonas faeni]
MRDRKMVLAVVAVALVTLAARHPTAEIRILTHESSDPSPHRMRAAVDFGLIGVSVLYTWTVNRLR